MDIRLNSHKQEGFLLLEAVLSIAIISTVLVLIVNSLSSLLRTAYFNQDMLLAVNLLDEKFFELQRLSELGLLDIVNETETQGNFSFDQNFTWQYQIEELEAENISLSQLDLAVSWTKHRRSGNISLLSFIK